MSTESISPIRRRFGQYVRELEASAQERNAQYIRMVQEVVDQAEVEIGVAQYALSARAFELSDDPLNRGIFDKTMQIVGEDPQRRSSFMRALEVARELIPQSGDSQGK